MVIAVFGVDPGLRGCGWAVATRGETDTVADRWLIVRLGVIIPPAGVNLAYRVAFIESELDLSAHVFAPFAMIAAELPQAYRQSKTPGDPNDNIALAAVAGAAVAGLPSVERRLVWPHSWMSATGAAKNKTIRHRRLLKSGLITPEALEMLNEAAIPSLRNNAYDAAGVALWAARELDRARQVTRGWGA